MASLRVDLEQRLPNSSEELKGQSRISREEELHVGFETFTRQLVSEPARQAPEQLALR